MRRTFIVVVTAVLLFLSVSAAMGAADSYCPELVDPAQRDAFDRVVAAANRGIVTEYTRTTSRTDRLRRSMESFANCLEKYKKLKFGSIFGFPNLSDAVLGVMEKMATEACNALDRTYDDITRPLRQDVVLPGSLGSVSIGMPDSGNLRNSRTPLKPLDIKTDKGRVTPEIVQDAEDKTTNIFRKLF